MEKGRGEARPARRSAQNEAPKHLIFLLWLPLVMQVKAAYSHHPSVLKSFNLRQGWTAEGHLVFFLVALGML